MVFICANFHGNRLREKDVKLTQSERKKLSRLLELLRIQGTWYLGIAGYRAHSLVVLSFYPYLPLPLSICTVSLLCLLITLVCAAISRCKVKGKSMAHCKKKKCTQSTAKEMKMKHFAY